MSHEVDLDRMMAGLRAGSAALETHPWRAPVAMAYHPLDYAWGVHSAWLRRWGHQTGRIVLVGMNPGPFGMAQTGVPFGDIPSVRDWLELEGSVGRPDPEHPRRPVLGFGLGRGEVSGQRLWGWARDRFGTPERFLTRFFVLNWCPALFLHPSGRNLTPDQLAFDDRRHVEQVCDAMLAEQLALLQPSLVVGVGALAAERARRVAVPGGPAVGQILHPSPASPAANRGWAAQAEAQLADLGVRLPQG
jgi:single-strand selective monofunctional uracil DNA glycosylase